MSKDQMSQDKMSNDEMSDNQISSNPSTRGTDCFKDTVHLETEMGRRFFLVFALALSRSFWALNFALLQSGFRVFALLDF
jgi:hypothetical protein